MSEPYEEPRHVVQICVSAGTAGEHDFLYALAEDGSMWRLLCNGRQEWERLDDLPWREKPIQGKPIPPNFRP